MKTFGATSQITLHGAEGGGHKRNSSWHYILITAISKDRVFFVGDNLNDVEAGLANGVGVGLRAKSKAFE